MNSKKDWFEEWFDENYLDVYSNKDDEDAQAQIKLLLNNVPLKANGASVNGQVNKILDLGCGTGRHVKIFKDLGYNAEGIDLSKKLIEIGKMREPNLAIKVGNALNYKMPQEYFLITSFFTSWAYYKEEEKNLSILQRVYENLSQGGYFWLDFMNSFKVRKQYGQGVYQNEFSIKGDRRVKEKKYVADDRIIKEIKIIFGNSERADDEKNYIESVRLYQESDIRNFFSVLGFKVIKFFGDYNGSEFDKESSNRLIFLVQK